MLNNRVISDNRIPTWGMRYDDAYQRNALPVPADQDGDPGPGGVYEHFARVTSAPSPRSPNADVHEPVALRQLDADPRSDGHGRSSVYVGKMIWTTTAFC